MTYLKIQSFVNRVEQSLSLVKYTAFLYNDQLIWYGRVPCLWLSCVCFGCFSVWFWVDATSYVTFVFLEAAFLSCWLNYLSSCLFGFNVLKPGQSIAVYFLTIPVGFRWTALVRLNVYLSCA